jgi:hypothetical protein
MSADDPDQPDTPSLERRVKQTGRHVSDQYVRIMRPTGSGIRGSLSWLWLLDGLTRTLGGARSELPFMGMVVRPAKSAPTL